jgi:putative phosphoribosyl transferase
MICASRNAALWARGEVVLNSHEFYAALSLAPNSFGLAAMFYSSGDSRRAAVQEAIAKSLRKLGLATCIVELLTPEESEDRSTLKDHELLSERMHAALDNLAARCDTRRLPLAVLAADASVPAALAVANHRAGQVDALVACYGSPDLAPIDLSSVTVPTLLVVPSKDSRLVRRNERVFESLSCASQLAVIVGASRDFSEPGTLVACDYVVQQWCERQLRGAARSAKSRC